MEQRTGEENCQAHAELNLEFTQGNRVSQDHKNPSDLLHLVR